MNRKSTLIAISLLLLAGATFIIKRGKDAPTTDIGKEHAVSSESRGARSKAIAESTANEKYHELIARYGEAKTKQARKVTASSINLLHADLRQIRMIGMWNQGSSMTNENFVEALDLIGSDIILSDAQYQKALELYKNYEKQSENRAEEAIKLLESNPEETMKFLLVSDACALGQGDIDEYNRLSSLLVERLKDIPALSSVGFAGSPPISRGVSPLDSPEFHDEFVKLLDPEQDAALNLHLKQRAIRRNDLRERIQSMGKPMSLEKVQEHLEQVEAMTSGMSKMLDAVDRLEELGVPTDPEAGK